MSETPPEPPVWSVVHVDYADEHGIIMQRYPRGWTEPGRDCDAPGFAYDTWADVCAMGATMLLTPASEPWLELARRVTASERTYRKLADESWRDLNVAKALLHRGIAEGLELARDHHAEVIAEFHTDLTAQVEGACRTKLAEAHAAGYAEAIARLRDDERYRNWWSSPGNEKPGAPIRQHLADYLEAVGTGPVSA